MFDLSKIFTVPNNLLKSKNYCMKQPLLHLVVYDSFNIEKLSHEN